MTCALWVAKDPDYLQADSKDSNQTGQMPRLILAFAGQTSHFVAFVNAPTHLVCLVIRLTFFYQQQIDID